MDWKTILNRLRNTGTILAITSMVLLVLTTMGVQVDNERVMFLVKAVCTIFVLLGVMNNTDTPGLDIPFITKKNTDQR